MPQDAFLCYVDECFAWFTTRALPEQWGDDWNDAPYECNAGRPVGPLPGSGEQWKVFKVAVVSDLETPCAAHFNSPWSVEQINAGEVPWLADPKWSSRGARIMAGTTFKDFVQQILAYGGHVFVPVERVR